MNIIKVINQLLILLLFVFASNAYAEKSKYYIDEVDVKDIKISKDRTGIVKGISCYGCGFNIVKITKNTKATSKGVAVDILEVKKLSDKAVGVAFDPKTREVIYLGW